MTDTPKRIAVIGGTGALGRGLALRWARAGHSIVVGSRDAGRAKSAAAEIADQADGDVSGAANLDAASSRDIVAVAVPFAAQEPTLRDIKNAVGDRLVIDVTVPLVPPKVGTVRMPPSGSAGLTARAILGESARIVSAFQNVAADHLNDLDHAIDCDVLVCGDKVADRVEVIALVEEAGMRGWHAGPLANSVAAEAMTSVLISINRHHKIGGAGIRITGATKADGADGH